MDSNSAPDFRMRGIANLQLYQSLINPFGYQMPVNPIQAMQQHQMLSNHINEIQKNMNNMQHVDQSSAQKAFMKQSYVDYNKKMQTVQYMSQPQAPIRHPHHSGDDDMHMTANYNRFVHNSKVQKSFASNNPCTSFETAQATERQNVLCRQSLMVQSTRHVNEPVYDDEVHKDQDETDVKTDDLAEHTTTESTSSIMAHDDLLDDNDSDLYKSYDSISVSSDFDKCSKAPKQKYDFTLNALDLSLYGYFKQLGMKTLGHAITDLKLLPEYLSLSMNTGPDADQSTTSFQLNDKSKAKASTERKKSSHFSIDNLLTSSCSNEANQASEYENLKNYLPDGTKYGPFPGKIVNPSEIAHVDDDFHMWEIFVEGRLSHFIDGKIACNQKANSNSDYISQVNNWMTYINCARFAQEQNLIAVQLQGEIYYEVCKDIGQGQELLVWYGDSYLQFLGIPVSSREMNDEMDDDSAESKDGFKCDRCGKVFAYKYYRDKHLKYTRCVDQGDRKFPCHLCSRSFEKRDRLRIHILHVHEKHRPHKCSVCGKSFSQSSSLNKHMRVHSGERPYKCIYCNKAFTASSILRTHIRQHSGEKPFKCKYCGKAFASHAAHDSHVRRTHCATKDKEIVDN